MARDHHYEVTVRWTAESGNGTDSYRSYSRDHEISAARRPVILGSADPFFRGDPERWNPEDLLVTSLSECHMLSYLALCALGGVVVTSYADTARGTMAETAGGGGHFTEVVLSPVVTVASSDMVDKALSLHEKAHETCFIASSVNFPVRQRPTVRAD
jgi:organic hydroperoxide reductase OsmC/OhrA